MEKVDHETFSIPDYQRGYRWDADIHVEALLNDIRDFMNMQQRSDERYCLQPIVVTESASRPGAWEVIDGQQRLTTLYLILKALEFQDDETFGLVFESRSKSNDFLRRLISEDSQSHETPDFHFISAAWEKIKCWLDEENKKSPRFSQKFGIALWENVNVIWYDIESTDRNVNIDVFNRLNVGKIPLTDAELVKALILSKIKALYKDNHELTMRQAEISNEWHRMEIELRKPQKWGFLTGNVQNEYESHIELLFDLLANSISKGDEKLYTTYLWFEKQIMSVGTDLRLQAEKAVELWDKIKEAYARISLWFCDNTSDSDSVIFHYVGYLLAARKEKIQTLFDLADGKSKKSFTEALRELVLKTVKDIDLDSLSYEDNREEIKMILLLFNVLTCMEISDGLYNRFPFDRYNDVAKESAGNGGWSLEHIYAQNSQDPIKNKNAAYDWLANTKRSIKNIEVVNKKVISETRESEIRQIDISDLKKQIDEMLSIPEAGINLDDFNALRRELTNVFGEISRHPLSNLALLSKKDNSALNNAVFPTKRDRIIQLECEGKRFIPICTRNVFLKFYSPADTQPYYWSEDDQEAYLQKIKSVINTFKEQ